MKIKKKMVKCLEVGKEVNQRIIKSRKEQRWREKEKKDKKMRERLNRNEKKERKKKQR